jgi:hypothetical protein
VRRSINAQYKIQLDEYTQRKTSWHNAIIQWQDMLQEVIERRNKLHVNTPLFYLFLYLHAIVSSLCY